MTQLRIEPDGPVWRLGVDRPPANALDLDLARAIAAALAEVEAAACRAIVLTGAGRFFSGGIDVKRLPLADREERAELLRTINATILRLYGLAKPAVAAVNGHALGGALVLALACDVRFAAAGEHRLGLTEAAAGIPFPAGPLLVVQAEVTGREARLATAVGEACMPERARAIGLIDAVVPGDRLLAEATGRAAELIAIPGFAAVKAQLRRSTLERMRAVIAADAEPLLQGWI